MAISVNKIYQTVLALANKEQRGYITPQEFNLFADQAQQEIFEQYFYDLNQAARVPGNDYVYADVDTIIREKLQIFEQVDGTNLIANYVSQPGLDNLLNKQLPSRIYRIHRIELNGVDCEILRTKDFQNVVAGGPLIKPTAKRPVANIRNNILRVSGGGTNEIGAVLPTAIYYFRNIKRVPRWSYVVVNNKSLYNDNISVDFELHSSEESELVYRILAYAGIAIQKPELTQLASQAINSQIQQEKQ